MSCQHHVWTLCSIHMRISWVNAYILSIKFDFNFPNYGFTWLTKAPNEASEIQASGDLFISLFTHSYSIVFLWSSRMFLTRSLVSCKNVLTDTLHTGCFLNCTKIWRDRNRKAQPSWLFTEHLAIQISQVSQAKIVKMMTEKLIKEQNSVSDVQVWFSRRINTWTS